MEISLFFSFFSFVSQMGKGFYFAGMLYLSIQVQRKGRNQAVAMLAPISQQVCGPMAQNYLLLPSLQARIREVKHKIDTNPEAEIYLTFFFSWKKKIIMTEMFVITYLVT